MRLALCRLIPLTSLLQGSRTWPQSHRSLSSPMKNLGSRYVSAPARERRLIALLLHEVHKFLTAHEVHESREGRAHRIRSYARSYQSASEPAHACDRAMRTTQPSPTCMNSRSCTPSHALLTPSLLCAWNVRRVLSCYLSKRALPAAHRRSVPRRQGRGGKPVGR